MARRFVDHRHSQSVEYTIEDLVTQRIYALAPEYEDLDDHDRLRADSVLAPATGKGNLTGKDRIRGRDRDWPLASSNPSGLNGVGHYDVEAEYSRYSKVLIMNWYHLKDNLRKLQRKRYLRPLQMKRSADRSRPYLRREGGNQSVFPLFLFIAAAILAAFFTGMYVQYSRIYPFPLIDSAYKTLVVHLDLLNLWDPAGVADRSVSVAECAPVAGRSLRELPRRDLHMYNRAICPVTRATRGEGTARVEFIAGDELDDPVLVKGEIGTFLDHCPGPWGCLAVEYSRSGAVSRTYPLRLEDVVEANIVEESDYPYEHKLGWSFSDYIKHFALSLHPSGDLLVVFQFAGSHPYGGGVARLAPDGQPRWYRKDYSHHWPHVVNEELILVPGARFERASLPYRVGPDETDELDCDEGMIWEDMVNVINGRGDLLKEVSILDAIVQSRYAGSLADRRDPCDPTHLNFVSLVGENAGGATGIAPGDWVVSLRHINAFGILDRDSRKLKRLVRGSFRRQHSVRHLEKARFLMFDNQGTDGTHGPSRLLMVDLATGKETTLFPNDDTPEHLGDWYVPSRGQFDVSPDGRRVLLVDPRRGRAFEIRLSDGEILNVFHQIHDVSSLTGLPKGVEKNAWLFQFHGIHYANRWEQ